MKHLRSEIGVLVLLVVVVFSHLMTPELIHNEPVYLLPGKMLANPGLLDGDWTWQHSGKLSLPFSLLVFPLWVLFGSEIPVALIARVCLWTCVFVCLDSFLRQLTLGRISRTLGVFLWMLCGQALVAGEWIIGGAEQKVLAYALVFLALSQQLRGKTHWAVFTLGCATLFHVAVGFWASLAFGVSVLLGSRTTALSQPLWKLAVAGLAYLPALLIAGPLFLSGSQPQPTGVLDSHELLVTFRNPHHLDPWYFLSLFSSAGTAVIFFATILPFSQKLHGYRRVFVRLFLAVLLGQFIIGVLARAFGAFWILSLYPFRVFDTITPLLFFVLGCNWVEMRLREFPLSRKLIRQRQVISVIGTIILLTAVCIHKASWRVVGIPVLSHCSERTGYTQLKDLSEWAQTNTEPSDVFVMNPFQRRFWILSERPMVVNWGVAPTSPGIFDEWYARIVTLNGGNQPCRRGFNFQEELTGHFARLKREQLLHIRQLYNGRFYVVRLPRPELGIDLSYASDGYFVYDLKQLCIASPPL